MVPLLLTLDTTELDEGRLARLAACLAVPHELACVTVTSRERGHDVTVHLSIVPETTVWGETRWGEAVWGGTLPEPFIIGETPLGDGVLGGANDDVFERALDIISSRSFPAPGRREALSRGQEHQLRDAMIFEAHVRYRRHVLVTNDTKAFVKAHRREQLEPLGRTWILTLDELEAVAARGQ